LDRKNLINHDHHLFAHKIIMILFRCGTAKENRFVNVNQFSKTRDIASLLKTFTGFVFVVILLYKTTNV